MAMHERLPPKATVVMECGNYTELPTLDKRNLSTSMTPNECLPEKQRWYPGILMRASDNNRQTRIELTPCLTTMHQESPT